MRLFRSLVGEVLEQIGTQRPCYSIRMNSSTVLLAPVYEPRALPDHLAGSLAYRVR
jgi:hypothetical protein